MSWGRSNIPTSSPTIAGLNASDTSSNQQAVPILWWSGDGRCPVSWIVGKVYNPRTEDVKTDAGKAGEVTSGVRCYGDVAGVFGLGLIHHLKYIESGNTRVWEGYIERPDDPGHPDYYEVKIATSVGDFYIAWGRSDQPGDTHLLGPLGATDATLKHPAYRWQARVVIIDYYFGQGNYAVPNTVIGAYREPRPEVGVFPARNSPQGESMLAAELELMTNPIFGAGIDAKYFTSEDWVALSAEICDDIGGHSPFLDRARPLRDVIKDLQGYYDGWKRLRNGKVEPGRFPHNGTIPPGLTELSVHDFKTQPSVRASTPSAAINEVVVNYRDGADYLTTKSTSESASDNARARQVHDPRIVEMPGIVTLAQAQAFAAESAATGAEGEWEAEGAPVRASRLKWADGSPLLAGDNVNIDLIAPEVDQVSRLTKIVRPFRGPPTIDFAAERGVYPTPYTPPADLKPAIGTPLPLAIVAARVLELTPALAGSKVGLPIAILAMRPRAAFSGLPALTSKDVLGFNLWFSTTGASYDSIGRVVSWAVRGTLRTALAASSGDVTVQLSLDAANLDLDRIMPQSADQQADNRLLLIIGDEIISTGTLSIAALDYDFGGKRARLGSRAAGHAAGDECWLIRRADLASWINDGFVEDTDRWFKLQPFSKGGALALSDVDPLAYHFRDRAPEKPVVVIDPLPGGLVAGVTYAVTGTISDVNGDLDHYVAEARLYDGPGGALLGKVILAAGDFDDDEKALFDLKTQVNFDRAGTWRVVVTAYDETGKSTRVQTAELAVAVGEGFDQDDGVTPDAPADFTVVSGIEGAILRWTPASNTPLALTEIFESETAVMPLLRLVPVDAAQPFYFRGDLPEGAVRYYWVRHRGKNGRYSAAAGPVMVTIVVWPRVGTLESSLAAETAERTADVSALNDAIDAEEAARSDADAVFDDRATALEATVNDPTTGLPATKARVDTIESTYASQSYADARKAEAIAAAAADATSKVSDEAVARASADTTLSSRATALESTVNNPTSGVAATKARVDTVYSTFATQSYADARKAEAIAAAAADATSKVSVETAARASDTGSLASEYVLKTTTSGGGVNRVAGFRLTNLGGAGGSSDFLLQADKIVLTNTVGANTKSPFSVVGGVVYINMAMIANASITDALIDALTADKVLAGTLTAMILAASKIKNDCYWFNSEDTTRFFGAVSSVSDVLTGSSSDGTTVLTSTDLIFEGWKRGSTGYAKNRFGNDTLVMDMNVSVGLSYSGATTSGTYVQIGPCYRTRTNGGSWGAWVFPDWADHNPNQPGSIVVPLGVDGAALAGTQSIQIGLRLYIFNGGTVTISAGGHVRARIYNV